MSTGITFVIDAVLLVTMAGLFGLILVLHTKLKEFSRDALRVPALADDLTKAITTSRTAMQELAKAARTDGALLEELHMAAKHSTQELTYLIDRAEKVLERFDSHLNNGHMSLTTTATPAQTPVAAKPVAPTATPATAPRPLEAATRGTTSQAAVMPGRYKKDMAVPQTTSTTDLPTADKPFKPTSFGATAAAYGAASRVDTTTVEDAPPPVASEAERELRRALGTV